MKLVFKDKSYGFAVRIVRLSQFLQNKKKNFYVYILVSNF
jgi:hypothetical protein